MTLAEKKAQFEASCPQMESSILTFKGVDGYDVYNCSIPFVWGGKEYMYGRVERRNEWARSWVRLFEKTGPDEYMLKAGSMIYPLEDPYISKIGDELVMGGTHVRYRSGKIDTFYGYFYRGTDLEDMYYFTTGPDYMKDIRLVPLKEGIGVFSRPRNGEIEARYGSASVIGFTVIPDLDHLTSDVIAGARVIPGLFGDKEWGGCNQCYLLDTGLIGIIAHKSYQDQNKEVGALSVYMNTSFVFDPKANKVVDEKILATRSCYPDAPAKRPELTDCTFTSGIVMRPDGKADLYAGLGDTSEGRIVIEDPFQGFGKIVGA